MMTQTTLQTTQDFTVKLAQLEQTLDTLRQRKTFLEEAIEAQKKPGQVLIALISPLTRRQSTLEVLKLRQDVRQIDLRMLDLDIEQQAVRRQQKRLATELLENAALLAEEQALEKAVRRVRLQEQQLELEKRQARLTRVQEQKARQHEREALVREQEKLLHQQEELQEHLTRVKTRLGMLPAHQPEEIIPLRSAVGSK